MLDVAQADLPEPASIIVIRDAGDVIVRYACGCRDLGEILAEGHPEPPRRSRGVDRRPLVRDQPGDR